MAKIIAQRRDATGKGWETWVEGDATPVFNFGKEPLQQATIDAVVAGRIVAKALADKRAAIDAAINSELDKRKAGVDIYSKTGVDAVTSIFTTIGAVK